MDENKVQQNTVPEAQPVQQTPTAAPQAPVAPPAASQPGNATMRRRRNSGVLDELKQLQMDVKEFKPSDLLIPAFSIIILLLLSAFVYIPMFSKAVEFRNESKEVESKITSLRELENDLEKIDVSLLQRDLADARKVIPFSLQVSDFVQYVNELAEDKDLEFKQILAGDIQIREANEKRNVDPVVRGVNGPLKYSGTLNNIVDFLDELQSVSPYIISSENIEIKKMVDSNQWELSLVTTGYYMNKESLPKMTVYSPFASYSQYSSIMDIFHEKADNTEPGNTSGGN